MKKYILLTFLFLNAFAGIFAQPGRGTNSPYAGLNKFLATDFIKKFDEARDNAEEGIKNFKRLKTQYSASDVDRVISAYNASADRFNDVLYKIKDDLLDKDRRKLIIASPDTYADAMENQLNRAKDFYAANFQRTVTEVTQGSITGSAFLLLLPELLNYLNVAFGAFQSFKTEIKKYNEAMLEQYLIAPHRFRSWEEIK
jgi:hypothetical protein